MLYTNTPLNKSVLFLLLPLLMVGCASTQAQDGNIKKISNQELQELQKTNEIQLVDIRTKNEYQQGYIAGAQLIDFMKPDFSEKIGKLDRDLPIVVYCAVGGRSHQSLSVLVDLGFKDIYDLQNGVRGWASEGLPLIK